MNIEKQNSIELNPNALVDHVDAVLTLNKELQEEVSARFSWPNGNGNGNGGRGNIFENPDFKGYVLPLVIKNIQLKWPIPYEGPTEEELQYEIVIQLKDQLDKQNMVRDETGFLAPEKGMRYFRRIFGLRFLETLMKQSPISMIYMDFDEIADINDKIGRDFSDGLILEACQRIKDADWLKKETLSFRIRGGQVVFIINNLNEEGAIETALRMREEVRKGERARNGTSQPFTASFGVSSFDPAIFKVTGDRTERVRQVNEKLRQLFVASESAMLAVKKPELILGDRLYDRARDGVGVATLANEKGDFKFRRADGAKEIPLDNESLHDADEDQGECLR